MSDCEDEQLIDYSQLLSKKKKKSKAPKRGVKNNSEFTDDDGRSLARQALFECIAPSSIPGKNIGRGQLQLDSKCWTRITQVKGTHLHTMGFAHQGQITLFLEEAAFLVARNALLVVDQDRSVTFEDFCQMICEEKDSWITYEKYQVYAYLKRLGFIVLRSKPLQPYENSLPIEKPESIYKFVLNAVLQWMYGKDQLARRPLVWDYRHKDYESIYSTLQIVPHSPWYKPFCSSLSQRFHWDVYKPHTGWKKSDPGEPDFRIIVKSVHDKMPTLYEQNQLFSQLPPISNTAYKPVVHNTLLSDLGPTFIIALVGDAEGVNFLRLLGDGLADISSMNSRNQKKSKKKI